MYERRGFLIEPHFPAVLTLQIKNDKSENSLKSLNMYNKAVISYICMGVLCM